MERAGRGFHVRGAAGRAASGSSPPTRGARILGALVAPILLYAAVLLYGMPDTTDRNFAWPVKPPMTALWMGSGYLAGAWFFFRVVFAPAWHRVAPIYRAVLVFASLTLVATVLHWDRFRHAHPTFVLWTAIYVLAPIAVGLVLWRNRRADTGAFAVPDTEVPVMARRTASLLVLASVLGLVLFVAPATAGVLWPWKLTPLTSRVVGAWLVVFGLSGLGIARDRRWSAWRVTAETATIWSAAVLLGVVRAWADFAPVRPVTIVFLLAVAFVFVFFAVSRWRFEPRTGITPRIDRIEESEKIGSAK